jgi:hypothetical protein
LKIQNTDRYTLVVLASNNTQVLKIFRLYSAKRPSVIPAIKSRNINILRILIVLEEDLIPEEKDYLWEVILAFNTEFSSPPVELVYEVLEFLK